MDDQPDAAEPSPGDAGSVGSGASGHGSDHGRGHGAGPGVGHPSGHLSGHRSGHGPGRAPVPDFTADRVEEDTAAEIVAEQDAGGPRFQWPLMVVLTGLVVSLAVVADDHFRRGAVLFAGFVVGAFFLRLILTDRDAGWLAVRSRGIDLMVLGVLGLGLAVFSLIVPPPS
jgi:hypothetical protein